MLYIWDIEKIIKETLNEQNLNINYEFNNNLPVPMSFNVSTNTIKFNYLQVNAYIGNFKFRETDENFVKIILYHALGYYLEFRKNPRVLKTLIYGKEEEKKQFLAEIEENAWELGRTLVPENLVNAYDQVRQLDKLLLKV